MGGGRKKGQVSESAEARDTSGVQDSEFTQFMKWMMERDERRRNEDRVRDETMLKMVEAISRKQSETTEEMRSTEQLREEARREELRIARERQQLEQDMWRERMENEREDREMWKKHFEEERVQKADTLHRHGLEDAGMMRHMGQPKLQRLSESDDVEHFLTTFERLAQAYEWPPDMWVLNLAPLLTGKAQSAYASMDMDKAREYQSVKEAILKRYDIHEETYRQRFRKAVKKDEESYAELGVRLTDMFNKWTGADKETRTKKEICEVIIMEQLTECMPTGLRIWLKERKPKTIEQVGELADDYISARKSAKEVPRRCHRCNQIGHVAAECGSTIPAEQKQTKLASRQTMAGNQGRVHLQPRCYRCNKLGHIATKCPENKGATWQQQSHYHPPMRHGSSNFVTTRDGMPKEVKQFEEMPVEYRVQGKVEGEQVKLLLDTGCSKSLIDASLVPPEKIQQGECVSMQCAHGDWRSYPTAIVDVEVGGKTYTLKVAVAENLPRHALLGRDVKDLVKMIKREDKVHNHQVLAVTTRHQQHDKRKRKRIFHIDMLKPWCTPEGVTYAMMTTNSKEEYGGDDIQQLFDDNEGKPLVNEELPVHQQEQMRNLLEEYNDVLSSAPGRTKLVKHKIDVGHAKPIRQRPYRLPWVHRDAVKKELDMMLKHGIIEESSSEWAQPIVVVPKKGSSEVRLCIDFRKVNQVAKLDSYPLPRIEDLIDKMAQAKYISIMDLSRGYWQIPLTDESKDITAFTTPFGLWQFVTMPFGLADAQATCQRLVDTKLIRGLEDHAAAYVDDLTVFSMSWEEHLVHLQDMLERLRDAGLTVKPKKCKFGMKETEYLGHVVGNGVVKPCQSKTEAVKKFQVPETKKQVRSFLGLAGYYRKFIKNFSDLAAPLTNLTKKREPQKVKWTQECDQAFRQLKEVLCNKPVLKAPDFTKEFRLQTDASEYGLGAVLSQKDEEGLEHPVVYISRKMLPRECNYATIEKECLAIK